MYEVLHSRFVCHCSYFVTHLVVLLLLIVLILSLKLFCVSVCSGFVYHLFMDVLCLFIFA